MKDESVLKNLVQQEAKKKESVRNAETYRAASGNRENSQCQQNVFEETSGTGSVLF